MREVRRCDGNRVNIIARDEFAVVMREEDVVAMGLAEAGEVAVGDIRATDDLRKPVGALPLVGDAPAAANADDANADRYVHGGSSCVCECLRLPSAG